MKGLKTILGLALATTGLGGAIAVGVVTNTQSNKVEQAEASVTNGQWRLNILVDGSCWWLNDNKRTVVWTGSTNAVLSFDGDLGASGDNNKTQYSLTNVGGTNYYLATYEMTCPASSTTMYFKRCELNSTDKISDNERSIAISSSNNTLLLNSSATASSFGNVFKVELNTGLELDNQEYKFVKASNYMPDNPSAPFGYAFEGWYTNSTLTTKYTKSTLTGDKKLYAKYVPAKEAYVAGSFNSWNGSDDNYLMSAASDNQYYIDVDFAKDSEFKVVYKNTWYGWDQIDQSSSVVANGYISEGTDPDTTGKRIKVSTAGKYEIYFKTTAGSNRIWIQQDATSEATTWAQSFLDRTSSICSTGGESADHESALSAIWSTPGSASQDFELMYLGNSWQGGVYLNKVSNNEYEIRDITFIDNDAFKIRVKNDWGQAWPADNQAVPTGGLYTVTFNSSTHAVDFIAQSSITLEATFKAMTSGAQGTFKVGTANATISEANSRYKHIVARYDSLSNFAGVTLPSPSNVIVNQMTQSNATIIIVIVCSVVAVSAFGLFFFLIRKKKYN